MTKKFMGGVDRPVLPGETSGTHLQGDLDNTVLDRADVPFILRSVDGDPDPWNKETHREAARARPLLLAANIAAVGHSKHGARSTGPEALGPKHWAAAAP